nr:hypothetical protein [Tanacetum cinerariifolium]
MTKSEQNQKKIKSKREAWKSPDSSPIKSKSSQSQESIKPRWENDPGKLDTAPDSLRENIYNCGLGRIALDSDDDVLDVLSFRAKDIEGLRSSILGLNLKGG